MVQGAICLRHSSPPVTIPLKFPITSDTAVTSMPPCLLLVVVVSTTINLRLQVLPLSDIRYLLLLICSLLHLSFIIVVENNVPLCDPCLWIPPPVSNPGTCCSVWYGQNIANLCARVCVFSAEYYCWNITRVIRTSLCFVRPAFCVIFFVFRVIDRCANTYVDHSFSFGVTPLRTKTINHHRHFKHLLDGGRQCMYVDGSRGGTRSRWSSLYYYHKKKTLAAAGDR